MKHLIFRSPFGFFITGLAFLFSACSSSGTLKEIEQKNSPEDVNYSIIYLIHGDADYLYHDSLGRARQADREVLKDAIRVGERAEQGEVFIFHQRPERKVLWLFPKKDRRLLHYRNGELISDQRYSPSGESGAGLFSTEARLYKQYETGKDSTENSFLLYFGHEIPYENGTNYYRSLKGEKMNTGTFSSGIQLLLPEERDQFDLVVLSTCNNGSPDMVHALAHSSRYLLASPQNLHLSHIDTKGLSILEDDANMDAREVAEQLSRDTYRRLTNTVQTIVSLSIFDMQEVRSYIRGMDSTYQNYLQSGSAAEPGSDNIDCSELTVFDREITYAKGVSVRYRPPRFGPNADDESHSGWGCKGKDPDFFKADQ